MAKRIFPVVDIILLCFFTLIAFILAGLFIKTFHNYPSENIDDWASAATYLSLVPSTFTILFIILTYKSQISTSAILQFESAFFQWYQIHIELTGKLNEEIDSFANGTIIPLIKSMETFQISAFKNIEDQEKTRNISRYYRSLYSMIKYIHLNRKVLTTYESRKKYYDIIQSRMTDNELFVVLYLLLCDKRIDEKEYLNGVTYMEVLDEAHLFKNLFYSKNNNNFQEFANFMISQFKKTAESKSFRFFQEHICEMDIKN